MAMKQLSSNVTYIKWSEVAEGSIIRGFFKESKPSKNYPDNLNHYIETEDGVTTYGLNGCGSLDALLKQLRPGWYTEIEYLGSKVLENGAFKGKECHQFNVKYDDERVHPLFSGDASARKEVEYKNSPTAEAATPALARPEQAPTAPAGVSTAAATSMAVASQTAAPQPAPAQKRSIF